MCDRRLFKLYINARTVYWLMHFSSSFNHHKEKHITLHLLCLFIKKRNTRCNFKVVNAHLFWRQTSCVFLWEQKIKINTFFLCQFLFFCPHSSLTCLERNFSEAVLYSQSISFLTTQSQLVIEKPRRAQSDCCSYVFVSPSCDCVLSSTMPLLEFLGWSPRKPC